MRNRGECLSSQRARLCETTRRSDRRTNFASDAFDGVRAERLRTQAGLLSDEFSTESRALFRGWLRPSMTVLLREKDACGLDSRLSALDTGDASTVWGIQVQPKPVLPPTQNSEAASRSECSARVLSSSTRRRPDRQKRAREDVETVKLSLPSKDSLLYSQTRGKFYRRQSPTLFARWRPCVRSTDAFARPFLKVVVDGSYGRLLMRTRSAEADVWFVRASVFRWTPTVVQRTLLVCA